MKTLKLAVFALGLTISFGGNAQTKIVITKGQKFTVESSVKSNSVAEVMGQSMETIMNSDNTTQYEIKDIDKDEIKITSTLTKISAYTSAMGQEGKYDSEKSDNSGELADILGKNLNKPRKIVMDPSGNIKKQDEDNMINSGGIAAISNSANSTTTEMYIPELIGRSLNIGDSIPYIGETKSEKSNTKDSGTYRITAVENGLASISYTGTRDIVTSIEQMGMEMQVTGTNAVKTELQMDINTGLVLVKATVIDMNLSIDAGGMLIPVTGKTVTTTKVTPQ